MRARAISTILWLLIAVCIAAPATSKVRGAATDCSLALVLAIDVSGSVDAGEFVLQIGGLADALRSEDVAAALAAAGSIYVTAVHWSGNGQQARVTPWTLLRQRADIEHFARLVEASPRAFDKFSTAIGEALVFADGLFASLPQRCRRRVIDVSGDGRSNEGWSPNLVRDQVVGRGVTINGLAILANDPGLLGYFRRSIIGGAGSFVIRADRFVDYPAAIRRKLVREILPPIAWMPVAAGRIAVPARRTGCSDAKGASGHEPC